MAITKKNLTSFQEMIIIYIMKAIAFDTLEFANRLKAAHFTVEQAETMTTAIASLINDQVATKRDIEELHAATKRDIEELKASIKLDIEELRAATKHDIEELHAATKRDIEELKASTKRDIEELRIELKRDMKELELRLRHDLTLRLGGMLVAGIGIVAALVKLL
ncbi:hypothetical protein Desac_0654 [Desulfobacca acetoxidans DSM 11109]|uniref:DUF1640 domain-containing protein n=2 Tax=Desulfobacca acetoxidans TaxID=60893 RepID=F2NGC3_DESAR|nr:hypothetical protein Desac_0654 [Desulfobacca acetoxidans DSM 11109]